MNRQPVFADPSLFPAAFRPLLASAQVYDSSCSAAARVWFLDRDGGYYLKRAAAGTLQKEAALTRFFHEKGLGTEVLAYETLEQDWLLTARIHGDYCLPNILLDNWRFSGFVDLDAGGAGDRHVDLFWGMWSLQFNLKTDAYCRRFLDAYGRNGINEELFPVIAAIESFL